MKIKQPKSLGTRKVGQKINDKTMIYVIYSGGEGREEGMTFVIDDNKENLHIVNAIKKVISPL